MLPDLATVLARGLAWEYLSVAFCGAEAGG